MLSIWSNCCINESHPETISKIKPFNDQYNWNKIDFPSHSKGWKEFESNNKSIALNNLYVPYNTKKIRHVMRISQSII